MQCNKQIEKKLQKQLMGGSYEDEDSEYEYSTIRDINYGCEQSDDDSEWIGFMVSCTYKTNPQSDLLFTRNVICYNSSS